MVVEEEPYLSGVYGRSQRTATSFTETAMRHVASPGDHELFGDGGRRVRVWAADRQRRDLQREAGKGGWTACCARCRRSSASGEGESRRRREGASGCDSLLCTLPRLVGVGRGRVTSASGEILLLRHLAAHAAEAGEGESRRCRERASGCDSLLRTLPRRERESLVCVVGSLLKGAAGPSAAASSASRRLG